MTTQEEIKENLKNLRNKRAEAITNEELEKELGDGVEKDPVEVQKPVIDIPLIDLTGAEDVRHIIDELKQLPTIKDVTDQLNKIDAYETYAKKIWVVKKSEQEVFDVPTRIVEKIEKKKRGDAIIERIIWKKDPETGFIKTQKKKFQYNSVPIQDKDEIMFLESERDARHFELIDEGSKINRMIKNQGVDQDESYAKYAQDKTWEGKMLRWQKALQDYWVEIFKLYFNASDEDIRSIGFDDIVNYGEVALYKAGVKSPK